VNDVATAQVILNRILPYIPPFWVRQARMDPGRSLAGREACFRAAVLFVDISGFTSLTEALSGRGPRGMEELSNLLDQYFAAMSEPVAALGGQVFKFAGDSLIVLFGFDGQDLYLRAALECARRMQQAVRSFIGTYTLAGALSLQIKIGISEGPVYTTTVGDEAGGMQPVLAGRALVRALQAEEAAEAGETVVDAMLTSRLPGRLGIGEARGTFRAITFERAPRVPVPVPHAGSPEGEEDAARLLVQRLKPYLAAQVLERIEQGEGAVLCEHRSVTTMFVRFGGLALGQMAPSPDASEPLSLPSLDGRVLQAYVLEMRDCIQRYGGRLNEVDFTSQGGTLVVFFGVPSAQENAELQAVLCAREMQQLLACLLRDLSVQADGSNLPDLRQCVGVCCGTVFVGDVGARIRRTYAVVGDAVNLASRLTGLAEWDEILVSESVHQAVQERFTCTALGEQEIRGKAEPVSVYRVSGPRRHRHADSPLSRLLLHPSPIGRTSELAVLEEVRERAWQGAPQLVQIVGQAGVGKSCLAGQLADRWLVRGGRVVAGDAWVVEKDMWREEPDGSPRVCALALAVVRGVLGLQGSDLQELQARRVRYELAGLSISTEDAGLLERFALSGATGLPAGEREDQPMHRAVIGLISAAAAKRPLLLILEDIDRMDDLSRDLLRKLALSDGVLERDDRSLLVCVTCRPTGQDDPLGLARLGILQEGESDLSGGAFRVTRMILEPLSETASLALAERLIQEAGLESDVLPALLRRGRGNPFFIQEMIHDLAGTERSAAMLASKSVPDEGDR